MTRPSLSPLPDDFPRDLLASALDLGPLHIAGLAWPYPDVLEAIAALTGRGYAVLGGDVVRRDEGGELTMTYDNWSAGERERGWSWQRYVAHSKREAVAYVERYHGASGGEIWYRPVVSTSEPRLLGRIAAVQRRNAGRVTWYGLRVLTQEGLAPYRDPVDALRALERMGYLERPAGWPADQYRLSAAGEALLMRFPDDAEGQAATG